MIAFLSEQYQSIYWAALTSHSDKTIAATERVVDGCSTYKDDTTGSADVNDDEDVMNSDTEQGKRRKLEQFERSMADSIAQDRKELGSSSADAEDTFDPAVLLSNISCFFSGSGSSSNNGDNRNSKGSSPRHSESPRGTSASKAGVHIEVAIDWNNVKSIIEMSYDDTEESNKRVRDSSRNSRNSGEDEQYTLKSKRTASTEITTTDVDGIRATAKGEQGCWDSFKYATISMVAICFMMLFVVLGALAGGNV